MANRYAAGASDLPFAVLRGYVGTDLVERYAATIKPITCPFTGEHADRGAGAATRTSASSTPSAPTAQGNVQLWGIIGVQKETVLASTRSLVTVEEIVDELEPGRARSCCRPGR